MNNTAELRELHGIWQSLSDFHKGCFCLVMAWCLPKHAPHLVTMAFRLMIVNGIRDVLKDWADLFRRQNV